jgi:hypothetical protein
MHRLGVEDEAAFQDLLRAAYGGTYSHRFLYEKGGVATLIRDGKCTFWGEFCPSGDGSLLAHTGILFKDPRGEYVESGLSLRRPGARSTLDPHAMWARVVADLPPSVGYVHQHTTTAHPLAQRYARRYLHAKPVGFVAAYTVGETVHGARSVAGGPADAPMDALAMTTALVAESRAVSLPDGPFFAWLSGILEGFGRTVTRLAPGRSEGGPVHAELFETSPGLSLERSVLAREPTSPLPPSGARTRLVHLPLDAGSEGAFSDLIAGDFLPVGVRLHRRRPDEIVFQFLPSAAGEFSATAFAARLTTTASLAPEHRAFAEAWVAAYRGLR